MKREQRLIKCTQNHSLNTTQAFIRDGAWNLQQISFTGKASAGRHGRHINPAKSLGILHAGWLQPWTCWRQFHQFTVKITRMDEHKQSVAVMDFLQRHNYTMAQHNILNCINSCTQAISPYFPIQCKSCDFLDNNQKTHMHVYLLYIVPSPSIHEFVASLNPVMPWSGPTD